jgi:hypothetical protein
MSSFEQPPQEKSSAPSLCTKGCGFFGCPNNQNMCSVCFINHRLATMSVDEVAPKYAVVEEEEAAVTPAEIRKMEAEEWKKRVKKAAENPYYANRCTRCLKKMGITERQDLLRQAPALGGSRLRLRLPARRHHLHHPQQPARPARQVARQDVSFSRPSRDAAEDDRCRSHFTGGDQTPPKF